MIADSVSYSKLLLPSADSVSYSKLLLPSGGAGIASDDEKLAVFFDRVRGTKTEEVQAAVSVRIAAAGGSKEDLADIFALWLYTRDVRGSGKGERALAQNMNLSIARLGFPATACRLVSLLPEFGSWRDVTALLMATVKATDGSVEAKLRGAALEALRALGPASSGALLSSEQSSGASARRAGEARAFRLPLTL